MKKTEAIKKIQSIPTTQYNIHQKTTIINILNRAKEDEVENWFKILVHKVKKGFVFDETTYENKVLGKIFTIQEDKELSIEGENKNVFIKGDNYNMLKNLLLTHKRSIDFIYIDPPYDTENMDTENNFLSDEQLEVIAKRQDDGLGKFEAYMDKFTTTGWLNSFKMRMELAYDLLSENGIFFLSLDDVHQADARIILDELFGRGNFVGTLIHQKKSGGGQAKYYYKGHDYIHVYAKNKKILVNGLVIDDNTKKVNNIEINGELYGYDTDVVRRTHGKYKGDMHRNISYEELLNTDPKSYEEWNNKIDDKKYTLIEKDGKHWISKIWKLGEKTKKMYSILDEPETKYNKLWNSDAKDDLELIIPEGSRLFDTPKPVDLIKLLISTTGNKNAIVLDFYAGSATTAQAVLELNQDDGGTRKFIVCTNDEGGTYKTVSYERIYRLLKGKAFNKKIDLPIKKGNKTIGLDENFDYSNFEYFKIKNYKPMKTEGLLFFNEKEIDISFASAKNNFFEDVTKEINKLNNNFTKENGAYEKLAGLKNDVFN